MPSLLAEFNDQLHCLASIGVRSNRHRGNWIYKCQKRRFFFRRRPFLPSDVPEKADRILRCIRVIFMGKVNCQLFFQQRRSQNKQPAYVLIESTAMKSVCLSQPKNSRISLACDAPRIGVDEPRTYPDCNVSNIIMKALV